MLKTLDKLSEIPKLIKYSKYLTESKYLSKAKSHGILQECSVYADSFRDSNNKRVSEKASEAMDALKDFSKWLRKKN